MIPPTAGCVCELYDISRRELKIITPGTDEFTQKFGIPRELAQYKNLYSIVLFIPVEIIPEIMIKRGGVFDNDIYTVLVDENNGLWVGTIQTSHIPVILLTARLSDEAKIESYKAGADSYIAKPFNFEVLPTRIKMLIEQQEKWKFISCCSLINFDETDLISFTKSDTDMDGRNPAKTCI